MQTTTLGTKIKLSEIPSGTTAIVRGRVVYSSVASVVDGARLEAENQKAKSRGRYPISGPYTSITIENPEIICENAELTAFLEQKCYLSKISDMPRYGVTNRGTSLPSAGHFDASTGTVNEIILERELATGSEVQLLLRTYFSKRYNKHGLWLSAVVVMDPEINYRGGWSSTNIANGMEAANMTWVPLSNEARANAQDQASAPATPPQFNPSQYPLTPSEVTFASSPGYTGNPWAD